MSSRIARVRCPRCWQWVVQAVNASGPNVCPNCCKMFILSAEDTVPRWIFGVLLFLLVSMQFVA